MINEKKSCTIHGNNDSQCCRLPISHQIKYVTDPKAIQVIKCHFIVEQNFKSKFWRCIFFTSGKNTAARHQTWGKQKAHWRSTAKDKETRGSYQCSVKENWGTWSKRKENEPVDKGKQIIKEPC